MNKTYLPEITDADLKEKLLNPDSAFLTCLEQQEFERLGLDRALLIASDIMIRYGRCNDFSILDAGANNGLIGRAIGTLGNRITSIDSDAVASQNMYQALPDTIQKIDVYSCLKDAEPDRWDFALLLSVAHHWESGYAMNGNAMYTEEEIHYIFFLLYSCCRYGVYMEMPMAEPGFEADFTDKFLQKYASHFSITEINRTIGSNGYQRRLFFLERNVENQNPMLGMLLRNAHLYEKMEERRLAVPRGEMFRLLKEQTSR